MSVSIKALSDSVSGLAKEMRKISDMLECGMGSFAYTKGYRANMARGDTDPGDERPDTETFRVTLYQDGSVDVMCFALPDIDDIREGRYDGVDALPNWVQERLAILMMIDYRIKPTPHIADVGRRISAGVYWVYSPKATPEEESRP